MIASNDDVFTAIRLRSHGQFRVIDLMPGTGAAPVEVTMRCVSLHDSVLSYHGLSYAWGNIDKTETIICNGLRFTVTWNLFSALQRLRDKACDTLWVDAICINQRDDIERANQVKQMKAIYSHAKHVWIDFGPTFVNTPELLVHIRKIGTVLFGSKEAEDDMSLIGTEKMVQFGLPPHHDDGWILWQQVFAQPYLQRTWVIQEFTVAKRVSVLLGDYPLDWNVLYHYADRMRLRAIGEDTRRRHPKTTLKNKVDAIQGHNGVMTLTHFRAAYLQEEILELCVLLNHVRGSLASDPKDKIFGVLGISGDVDLLDPNFEVRYDPEETVAQLFIRIARGMIRANRKNALNLLLEGGTQVGARMAGLPSWVPDWTKPRAGKPLGGLARPPYHAADGMEWTAELKGNAVYVRGQIVDRVAQMTSALLLDAESDHSDNYFGIAIAKWTQEAFDLVLDYWPDIFTGEDKESMEQKEALWRTLISNKTIVHEPAPECYGAYFETSLRYHRPLIEAIKREDAVEYVGAIEDEDFLSAATESYVYRYAVHDSINTKRFCVTADKKFMGKIPGDAQVGDYVVLIAGSPVPFIMRKASAGDRSWKLIQECYIHGIMNGEYAGEGEKLGEWEDIVII